MLFVLLGNEVFKAGEAPLLKVIKALLNALNGNVSSVLPGGFVPLAQ